MVEVEVGVSEGIGGGSLYSERYEKMTAVAAALVAAAKPTW